VISRYSKQARKFFEKQGKETESRIKRAVDKLPIGDVTKMGGYADRYRLRVGDYRIIFTKDKEGISVRKIDNRGQVYKD